MNEKQQEKGQRNDLFLVVVVVFTPCSNYSNYVQDLHYTYKTSGKIYNFENFAQNAKKFIQKMGEKDFVLIRKGYKSKLFTLDESFLRLLSLNLT